MTMNNSIENLNNSFTYRRFVKEFSKLFVEDNIGYLSTYLSTFKNVSISDFFNDIEIDNILYEILHEGTLGDIERIEIEISSSSLMEDQNFKIKLRRDIEYYIKKIM
ncbi:hypothetical protein M5X17_31200 [Paenibacillus alvei]|uniref:hypothetical protein n=1 Tax=Paenibacillus alvei TaxID=44250 RepID=UPI002281F070|nr:hypothetical protein [Paenibacillus alvei]MCY9738161.1 hypothetical protein [Paenibacillus alvei]